MIRTRKQLAVVLSLHRSKFAVCSGEVLARFRSNFVKRSDTDDPMGKDDTSEI